MEINRVSQNYTACELHLAHLHIHLFSEDFGKHSKNFVNAVKTLVTEPGGRSSLHQILIKRDVLRERKNENDLNFVVVALNSVCDSLEMADRKIVIKKGPEAVSTVLALQKFVQNQLENDTSVTAEPVPLASSSSGRSFVAGVVSAMEHKIKQAAHALNPLRSRGSLKTSDAKNGVVTVYEVETASFVFSDDPPILKEFVPFFINKLKNQGRLNPTEGEFFAPVLDAMEGDLKTVVPKRSQREFIVLSFLHRCQMELWKVLIGEKKVQGKKEIIKTFDFHREYLKRQKKICDFFPSSLDLFREYEIKYVFLKKTVAELGKQDANVRRYRHKELFQSEEFKNMRKSHLPFPFGFDIPYPLGQQRDETFFHDWVTKKI